MSSALEMRCIICSNGAPQENLTPAQMQQRKILHFNREFYLRDVQRQLIEELKKLDEAKHFNMKAIEVAMEQSQKEIRSPSPPPPAPRNNPM